ncbi:type VI secretion system-associated protein TagF [Sulfitobacter albidus]|uniref:Type VI secretion system-associated protein TagF n=1 Tax=Sulfitobacter albidus TaxID=2829501 RepID=A0A975JGJ8_9RHOB|nr:type VI secretion system-associated protein TagF [Sulfitobacter albidus]QUJ78119.1 type VI secretion system-associated protein TagF [Sulfitobacter albidus]
MDLVIYGKHPAFGDFLSHGLPHPILHKLDAWLERVLPTVRKGLGDDWEAAWAAAPTLYFWLGPDIIGVPLLGLMAPSQDKVGRRFPLVLGLSDVITPPPVHRGHDATPFLALSAHLDRFEVPPDGTRGAATLAANFDPPALVGVPFEDGQDGTLWGHREDGDLGRLFADAADADAQKAQLGRSHWWHADTPTHYAGWLAANGLPDAEGLAWLLTARWRETDGAQRDD